MSNHSFRFLYAACQVGGENSCKRELLGRWPHLRFSYSRKGFLTFGLPETGEPSLSTDLQCALTRCHGLSLADRVELTDSGIAKLWPLAQEHLVEHVHVWPRQLSLSETSSNGPPHVLSEWIEQVRAASQALPTPLAINRSARPQQRILDVIHVEPQLCWTGLRTACSIAQRWVGGAPRLRPHPDMVSRAYLKMKEALLWSRLPVQPGQVFVEIGSAPGGSTQALLEKDLRVVGVDPALMDPRVAQAPGFTHLLMRAAHARRRLFRDADWLSIDTNVAPKHALDTVERIVTQPNCRIAGLLLTLKLADWQLTDEIPHHLERVRQWGYRYVKARQLAHNRREYCVMALRRKHLRRGKR